MFSLYVTAIHDKRNDHYYISSVHLTLRGAKNHFVDVDEYEWAQVQEGCWEVAGTNKTATIEKLDWHW